MAKHETFSRVVLINQFCFREVWDIFVMLTTEHMLRVVPMLRTEHKLRTEHMLRTEHILRAEHILMTEHMLRTEHILRTKHILTIDNQIKQKMPVCGSFRYGNVLDIDRIVYFEIVLASS